MRNRFMVGLAAGVLPVCIQASESRLPADCDVALTVEQGTWVAEGANDTARKKDVHLRLRRLGGEWVPVFAGSTVGGPNATHRGFVTSGENGADGESLTLRMHVQDDPWSGGGGEAAYRVQLAFDGGTCRGSWTGVVHGAQCGGTVTGAVETLAPAPGFVPPVPGEHPRFLIRKADLPALKAKAETPWGREMVKSLRADQGILAQAFAYALTGDRACATNAQAAILKSMDQNGWYQVGIAHAPAFIASEHLMAYDLMYDACDESFRRRMSDALSGTLDLFYWGTQNTQFNPQDTSNWSLMYRSGLGFLAMTAMDLPAEPVRPAPGEFPRLKPPADLAVGPGVPAVVVSTNRLIDGWIFAGPVEEGRHDDAFRDCGGIGAARPEVGTKAGNCVFRAVTETNLVEGVVDLAALAGRRFHAAYYLYAVVEAGSTGYYRLRSMLPLSKGVRQRVFHLAGHRMEPDDVVHLDAGRYPLMARIFAEPVGKWEPFKFSASLAAATKAEAMAWFAAESGGASADAFCGASWREELHRKTGWNPEAWGYAQMAAYKAERYFVRGLGEHGWNQEGEAYTRHAVHMGMPFAHAYRNVFGADIRGADRMGMMLALATAQTVFSEDGARMQSYSIGGGPMDLTLFARGFTFVPEALKPAVLWAWNRTEALGKAGKFNDPHGVYGEYDGVSKVMCFLNYPLELKERNPGEVMPRVTVDRQKGGYVFRNRWSSTGAGGAPDGDDCVVQMFANSNLAGGSWSSHEAGTFRIDGLGVSWAVRGQGMGHAGSGRGIPDASLYQNTVDVGEQWITASPQAWTTHFESREDGSGVVSLNMDEVYVHGPRQEVRTPGQGGAVNVDWKGLEPRDLGIRAVRSMGVDYSGKCGAPCLVAVADRITGTRGSNVWQMATERENVVTFTNNQFTVTARNGATLRGTVARPAGAAIRTVDYEHVHEINYHGRHAKGTFQRTAILVGGMDRDQEFLVVMTLQNGVAPAVEVRDGGKAAAVGTRTVRFSDGVLVLE